MRKLREFFFVAAHFEDGLSEESFFAGAVVDEEEPVPFGSGAAGGIRRSFGFGFAEVAEDETVFEERGVFLGFGGGEAGLGGGAVVGLCAAGGGLCGVGLVGLATGDKVVEHGGADGGEVGVVPEGEEIIGFADVGCGCAAPDDIEGGAGGELGGLDGSLGVGARDGEEQR